LGWIAERYPQIVRRIVDSGHELASHGYAHLRVWEQDRASFSVDIHRAKRVLEDISGLRVRGYRAPSFSIRSDNRWAFETLEEAGYEYSSSIYPIRHDHYGAPDAPRFVHQVGAHLIEVPITTIRLFERNWPAGGGGYFRLMPYALSRWLIRRVNQHDRQPAIFFFHPWELDPGQPRIRGIDLKTRFRHYVNISYMEQRLRRMLSEFSWDRLDRVVVGEHRRPT
jgi:polysaccharide deacetylase family protein (PEP-CTERM system associated)